MKLSKQNVMKLHNLNREISYFYLEYVYKKNNQTYKNQIMITLIYK